MISSPHAPAAKALEAPAHPGTSAAVSRLLQDALGQLASDQRAALLTLVRASGMLDAPRADDAERPVVHGGLARWQIIRVARYIEAHLGARILQKHLAAEVRLSCGHFARAFKLSFGRSPHAFVVERRIERAKVLMLGSPAPLCDIALTCGLADQAHFSRVFRRVTGSTPLAWRRRHQAAPRECPAREVRGSSHGRSGPAGHRKQS